MSTNSFDSRAELTVGDRTYSIYRLDALQSRFDVARLPFSLKILLENLLRNEDGETIRAQDIEALATWDAAADAQPGDRLHPGPRGHAGLHRRAGGRRPRRDARRDARTGRRREQDQPARPGRAGHRPLRAGRRVRHPRRVPAQRRARVRAQRGALRLPALGPGRLRQLQGRPARHRDRASGQPRVPGPGRVRRRRAATPIPTRWSAPTRTRRWSTAWACSAGAWAGSRPRRRCSASRCRC